MSSSPRRLTFVVGTSLLTASLATGCKSKPMVNPGPETPIVNTAPTPDAPADETAPADEIAPADAPTDAPAEEDPKHVNTVHPGE